MDGLMIFVSIVIVWLILTTPIDELKILSIASIVLWTVIYLLFDSFKGAFWVTAIVCMSALGNYKLAEKGIYINPSHDYVKTTKKKKISWYDKRNQEKKLKKLQYERDIDAMVEYTAMLDDYDDM